MIAGALPFTPCKTIILCRTQQYSSNALTVIVHLLTVFLGSSTACLPLTESVMPRAMPGTPTYTDGWAQNPNLRIQEVEREFMGAQKCVPSKSTHKCLNAPWATQQSPNKVQEAMFTLTLSSGLSS